MTAAPLNEWDEVLTEKQIRDAIAEAKEKIVARARRIEELENYADLAHGAVAACRRWAEEGLGFNCTFVDDDARVMVGLAQRAVLAGLVSDFSPDMQRRFKEAAERHRAAHEASLKRPIPNLSE